MAEVFVSYARENRSSATRVADALRAQGFSVWLDDELPAHRAYTDVIEQRLAEARAVVVLWSKSAVASQWVRAEADFARNSEKLVQARLDSSIPPMPFNQIECAELKRWRGNPDHPGWAKLAASVAALVSGEERSATRRPTRKWTALIAASLLLALAAAAVISVLVPRMHDGGDVRPVVAVLPFKSLAASDEGLVAGIWEDTRQALSQNPQLVVLGPHTSQELTDKGGRAARKAADYLLEATVRSAGERIRVNVSLTRSSDAAEIWSETFDRPLDDVFALQSAIASEIEGRIRGRLARQGGVRPENIVTTGEVYALYSDATAKIRNGNPQDASDAYRELQQVVAKDPNFAPGWAALSIAGWYTIYDSDDAPIGADLSEAQARKAIALAPNLAQGYAALGLALGQGPAAQQALRRAVELDGSNIQALTWLADTLNPYTQRDELNRLCKRITQIEPLWTSAVLNRVDTALAARDYEAAGQELERVTRLDDRELAALIEMAIAGAKGDLSGASAVGLQFYNTAGPADRDDIAESVSLSLLRLGLQDDAAKIFLPEGFVPYLRSGDSRALPMIEARVPPRLFWRISGLQTLSGKIYLANGRPEGLVRYYRQGASSADQFARSVVGPRQLPRIAPALAIALTETGSGTEGRRLLELAESSLGDAPTRDVEAEAFLSRIRAAQGRNDEAIGLLSAALRGGWVPDFYHVPMDLAQDPAFQALRSDPRFVRLRNDLLRYVGKERAELGSVAIR